MKILLNRQTSSVLVDVRAMTGKSIGSIIQDALMDYYTKTKDHYDQIKPGGVHCDTSIKTPIYSNNS